MEELKNVCRFLKLQYIWVVIEALISKERTIDYFFCQRVAGFSSAKYKTFIGKMLSQQKLNCLDTPCLKINSENKTKGNLIDYVQLKFQKHLPSLLSGSCSPSLKKGERKERGVNLTTEKIPWLLSYLTHKTQIHVEPFFELVSMFILHVPAHPYSLHLSSHISWSRGLSWNMTPVTNRIPQ